MVRQAFVGPLIHTDDNGTLIIIQLGVVIVEDGKINAVLSGADASAAGSCDEVFTLDNGQFLIPGFIDAHTHAVQLPNLGIGYDKSLLDWLETYTFPLERSYTDVNLATRVFEAAVKQTIRTGTTTACYFASLYAEACTILAQKAVQFGQRAFVGKVNMNQPRDDGYYETTEASIGNTERFVKEIQQLESPLVKPIITPRFALSCDMELMQALGKMAREMDLHVQTHVSENIAEIEAVMEAFQQQSSYAAIYDAAGLLTPKTVLAHGVYLTDTELTLLATRETAIIHCPSSNTSLRSGICDVQRLRAKNIKVGLGTDVSGASSFSMLEAMRSALQVSYQLSMLKDNYTPLSYKDVFHMATLGGANALSIGDKVGNLLPGKEFDALVIDLNADGSVLDDLKDTGYTLEEKLQRLIYSGDDRNIVSVYISGRKVK
ncbi:PREDICTED: guanine deaminase [Dinoponera quadriceps]|uniref:Guanine deaminase n=1 Tax=Dinoponera quadriceps TaxID=609295 RepID=A0A6P3X8H1_DINQU|nr:PREDICTED: guanine deaminase [Dinoponera quadriceps]XP_014474612.1 PREDICTED: guanine deaminase [Dinoponera quadriceps]XP_014474613.1 PREDICTED: guanine deaminase [Dinoponera quadriceps]XP_014474614.1 PREDICTED: guanine deaminase [Dinoponera quadriceps]XP_014474615.1 PREDICTED: guanine deaminase [Dinoponera quadriceps]